MVVANGSVHGVGGFPSVDFSGHGVEIDFDDRQSDGACVEGGDCVVGHAGLGVSGVPRRCGVGGRGGVPMLLWSIID